MKTTVGYRNGRKIQETAFYHLFKLWSIFTGYTIEGDRLHACFYILILYNSSTIKFKKFLILIWPNGELEIDNSKFSSSNDYMFGQSLKLLNCQEVKVIDSFSPLKTKKIVKISEKFELT